MPRESTTGPKIMAAMPFTENPGTNTPTNQKQIPLTTKENKPSVKRLIGRDSRDRMGRIEPLIKPKTIAAMIAVLPPPVSSCTQSLVCESMI